MTVQRGHLLLFGFALLVGCDGLGAPVVDDGVPAGDGKRKCLRLAPRCAEPEVAPDTLDVGAAPGELAPCVLAEADVNDLRLTAVLRDCTLSLGATNDPDAERQIVASQLDNVRIELAGTVHLQITESQLFRVTLQAEPMEGRKGSTLQITHSNLHSSALRADHVQVISSLFARSSLESRELSAVDLQARESVLAGGAAMISAARLRATHVGPCDTLLIAESALSKSRIDACAGVTRLYDVEATACTIDGELESEFSTFVDGRFGVRQSTQLHGWDTSADNSALCDSFDSLRFSASAFTCVTCQGPMAQPEADVCSAQGSPAELETNPCAALREPPICETFPRRTRPVSGI